MAVYTEVTDERAATLPRRLRHRRAAGLKGIAEGVENSNYLLPTERGRFILTLYEKRVERGGPALLPRR